MGVTVWPGVSAPKFATYAVFPFGVIAIALGSWPTLIAGPAVVPWIGVTVCRTGNGDALAPFTWVTYTLTGPALGAAAAPAAAAPNTESAAAPATAHAVTPKREPTAPSPSKSLAGRRPCRRSGFRSAGPQI